MIRELTEQLQTKQISCEELTKGYLERIQSENGRLNAYVTITAEEALKAAVAVDQQIQAGEKLSSLAGIPMTLKDNLSTKGIVTTCCSKMLEGYRPIYNATVWEELQKMGAVLLGKTNMDEFAMGSSCETSCYGGAKNPYNENHVAGGSSGGGAAAVAASLAVYALGSDTGGSIRQPSSFCGTVGFKPTYGTVSRYGLIAYASSFDQVGPIAECVEDAAIIFDAISRKDEKDSTCVGRKEPVTPRLKTREGNFTIGVVEDYFTGTTPQVKEAVLRAIDAFESAGATVRSLSIPSLKAALPVYYILASAEASSNLGRYDGIRYGHQVDQYQSLHEMICHSRKEGFGKEVQRRILLGTYVLCSGYYDAYYKKAKMLQYRLREELTNLFANCDILLAPTVSTTAFAEHFTEQDPVQTYQTDLCTVPVNIAGLPALSVPCGTDSSGLPIGLQIIGNRFDDLSVLQAGYFYEQMTGQRYLGKKQEVIR